MNYIDERTLELLVTILENNQKLSREHFRFVIKVGKVLNSKCRKEPIRWVTIKGNHIPIMEGDIEAYVKRKLAWYKDRAKKFVYDSSKPFQQLYREFQAESEAPAYMYPMFIAGKMRGEPMSFEQANNGRSNPQFDFESDEFLLNCQSCVLAHEARLRGYNVQAAAWNGSWKQQLLAFNPFFAWIDPKTNEKCEPDTIDVSNGGECYDWLEKYVKKGRRYHFAYYWQEEYGPFKINKGHILTIDRDNEGKLRCYDPQNGELLIGYQVFNCLTIDMVYNKKKLKPKILRVDDKKFNPYFKDDVLVEYIFND